MKAYCAVIIFLIPVSVLGQNFDDTRRLVGRGHAVPPSTERPTSTTTQATILKSINERNDDGSYTYGYEASDGSFKLEKRFPNGRVQGKYGYIDELGELKVIEYGADMMGFQPQGDLPKGIIIPPPVLSNLSDAEQAELDQKQAEEDKKQQFFVNENRARIPSTEKVLPSQNRGQDLRKPIVPPTAPPSFQQPTVRSPFQTNFVSTTVPSAPERPRSIPNRTKRIRTRRPPLPSSGSADPFEALRAFKNANRGRFAPRRTIPTATTTSTEFTVTAVPSRRPVAAPSSKSSGPSRFISFPIRNLGISGLSSNRRPPPQIQQRQPQRETLELIPQSTQHFPSQQAFPPATVDFDALIQDFTGGRTHQPVGGFSSPPEAFIPRQRTKDTHDPRRAVRPESEDLVTGSSFDLFANF